MKIIKQNYFKATILFIIGVSCFVQHAHSQTIAIDVNQKPLQEVFLELRDNYNIQFSFNDQNIQNCSISKSKSYSSAEEAIQDLIKDCNLIYKKSGSIFIILPAPKKEIKIASKKEIKAVPKKKYYTFSGKILDKINAETLPFAAIQYQDKGIASNPNGNFSFKVKDSLVHLKISYVGYYQIDTLLFPSKSHKIKLIPSAIGLKEILIQYPAKSVFTMHLGQTAGAIKINHKITSFLAGNRNNTIYNILRLQPGIMAAGEQTNDYTIWGSYRGQNLVSFDNITLFNISSFDDNISAVNSLIVKEIEVKKGGFNAEFSNRVGGIVLITGKDGSYEDFSGDLNLNNQVLSGRLNVPIAKRFALQTSFRQSFDNFLQQGKKIDDKFLDSKSKFRDMNIKLAGKVSKADNFYVNLMTSDDDFGYEYTKKRRNLFSTSKSQKQIKKQNGLSLFYNKQSKSGAYSHIILSYSDLNKKTESEIEYEDNREDDDHDDDDDDDDHDDDDFSLESATSNGIKEMSAKINHYFLARNKHQFSLGVDFTQNASYFTRDTSEVNIRTSNVKAQRLGGFVKDNISISNKLNLQTGLRMDFMENIQKVYFQPRINLSFQANKKWKINLAYGIYNQFIVKNTLIDNLNNYLYIWEIADNKRIPVLESQHYVAGLVHSTQNTKFSIEAFYKKTDNITLYFYNLRERGLNLNRGTSRVLGLDFYFKKTVNKHEFWTSYTLSQNKELFSNFQDGKYQLSPYNQTHEIKTAGIFNFSPFYISMNYVYGSGLEFTKTISNADKTIPYKRLDIALLYKFNTKKTDIDVSFSILNLLNTKNVRYNDFANFPNGDIIYAQSTPFTPLLNLNFSF